MKGGDTVYIRGGTYNERVEVYYKTTNDKYMTLAAYPGETAIIDGTGIVTSPLIILEGFGLY